LVASSRAGGGADSKKKPNESAVRNLAKDRIGINSIPGLVRPVDDAELEAIFAARRFT
jgi:hypothetical protein